MKIAIVFSLLVSLLISSVLSGTPCPTAPVYPTACVAEGEFCNATFTCNDPLYCQGFGATAKCAKLGTIGQSCATLADCTNVTNPLKYDGSTVGCSNGTCQYTGFLGFNESCNVDSECMTSLVCDAGSKTCQGSSIYTCINACPATQYCNSSQVCVDLLDLGANCSYSTDCKGLLVCSGTPKVCSKQLGFGQQNDSCTTSSECSGCLGCRPSTKTCDVATKSPAWNTVECDAPSYAPKAGNCTDGTGYCSCEASSSELRCQTDEQVISYGGCLEFFDSLETCLVSNGCPLPATKTFYGVPKRGCAAKCAEFVSCAIKCQLDVNVFYGNPTAPLKCGQKAEVYACTKTVTNPDSCPGTTGTFAGPSTGSPSTAVTETTTDTGAATVTTTNTGATSAATGATSAGTTTATGTTTAAGTTTQVTSATTGASSAQSTTGSASSIIVGLFLAVVCLCF